MSVPRVLLVDDSEAERFLHGRALLRVAGKPIELDEAAGADDAIEKLRENDYHVVFLDIHMPGRDGFHVLEHLRESERSSWPLVIIWSTSIHPDDVSRSYGACANLCLRKPDSLDSLRDVARRCIEIVEICARPPRA